MAWTQHIKKRVAHGTPHDGTLHTTTAPETSLVSAQREATSPGGPAEKAVTNYSVSPLDGHRFTEIQTECFAPKSSTGHGTNCEQFFFLKKVRNATNRETRHRVLKTGNLESLKWNRICQAHVQQNSTQQWRSCLHLPSKTCTTEKHIDT